VKFSSKVSVLKFGFRIETQDVILAEKKTERIIEVGPSNTLISMAQKTLAYKYEASDVANAFQRQLLCSKSHSDEIYYVRPPPEHDDRPDPASSSSRSNDPVADLRPVQPEPREAHSRVVSNPTINPASSIPDVAVTAQEVVKALVAIAVKKPSESIVLSNSIKFLSAGITIPDDPY
jgi:fatty acid synthase subunit alpha